MSRNGRNEISTKKRSAAVAPRRAASRRAASQQARLRAQRAFLERFIREKREAWEAMTLAERRAATAQWKRFVKSINAGRDRKVIVE